jgi:hypothetical protein
VHRFLHIDEKTCELRLVITELLDGMHERTEFRVLGSGGDVLRGVEQWGHLEGRRVEFEFGVGRFYLAPERYEYDASFRRTYLNTPERAIGVIEKVACPRATNRRRRCEMCRADEARSAATTGRDR